MPTPGGPQRMSDGTRSSATARRRNPFAPTTASGPSTSSSERGRIRSASGVDGANPPSPSADPAAAAASSGPKRSPLTARPRGGGGTASEQTGTVSAPLRTRTASPRSIQVPQTGSRTISASRVPPGRAARGPVRTKDRREEDPQAAQHRQEEKEDEEIEDDACPSGARADARDLLLDLLDLRDLGVALLDLVVETLRGDRVPPVVRLDEQPVQERLPVVGVVLARLLEVGDGELELAAVAVRGAEVGEQVGILRRLASRLLVGRDRPVPVLPVVVRGCRGPSGSRGFRDRARASA